MAMEEKLRHTLQELKAHTPFTLFGAVLGIAFMLLFRNIGKQGAHTLFLFFHPAHVVLSAMVTAALPVACGRKGPFGLRQNFYSFIGGVCEDA